MKITLEIEIKPLNFKPEVTNEQILKFLQRKVENINSLILNSRLDDSRFARENPNHPMYLFESDLKVIGFEK